MPSMGCVTLFWCFLRPWTEQDARPCVGRVGGGEDTAGEEPWLLQGPHHDEPVRSVLLQPATRFTGERLRRRNHQSPAMCPHGLARERNPRSRAPGGYSRPPKGTARRGQEAAPRSLGTLRPKWGQASPVKDMTGMEEGVGGLGNSRVQGPAGAQRPVAVVEAPDCSPEQGLRVSSQKEGLLGTCPADDRQSFAELDLHFPSSECRFY